MRTWLIKWNSYEAPKIKSYNGAIMAFAETSLLYVFVSFFRLDLAQLTFNSMHSYHFELTNIAEKSH